MPSHNCFRSSFSFGACSRSRSEEHTSELQSRLHLVCRLLLEKKKKDNNTHYEAASPSISYRVSSMTRRLITRLRLQDALLPQRGPHLDLSCRRHLSVDALGR